MTIYSQDVTSHSFSIIMSGTGIFNLGNGLKARKSEGDIDKFYSSLEVEYGETIIAIVEENCPPIVRGKLNDDTYVFSVSNFDNSIILEDFCYGDFFSHVNSSESVSYFLENENGAYVYESEIASFRLASQEEKDDPKIKKYALFSDNYNLQTKNEDINAYFDTSDIVFADYAVGDAQVDTWITANPSISGLYMTFIESTDTKFKKEVTRVQLSGKDKEGKYNDGRWENKVYCGTRIIESKQFTPDSYDSKAIKYRFRADFTNNGKDDIEIQQLNILSALKIFEKEGGENA